MRGEPAVELSLIKYGLDGFYTDRDDAGMFNAISTIKDMLLVYVTPDVINQKVIVNQTIFPAVASGQGAFLGHPPFDPTNNAGTTALKSFYNVTLPLEQVHTCGPSKTP